MIGEVAPIFSVHYPSHFAQRFGDELESVMAEYALVVQQNGLKRMDVLRGVSKIRLGRAGKWLPNPIEFAELCKPDAEELGLPNMDQVAADLDSNIAWNRRHPVRRYKHRHGRMSALIARDILSTYRTGTPERRAKLLESSYKHWLDVARATGLPEEVPAIARTAEPRPIVEQFIAKNGRVKVPTELSGRFARIAQNLRERKRAG